MTFCACSERWWLKYNAAYIKWNEYLFEREQERVLRIAFSSEPPCEAVGKAEGDVVSKSAIDIDIEAYGAFVIFGAFPIVPGGGPFEHGGGADSVDADGYFEEAQFDIRDEGGIAYACIRVVPAEEQAAWEAVKQDGRVKREALTAGDDERQT